jgi:serine/threonine-protein kinase SRPK3
VINTCLFQLHESSSVTFTDIHLQRILEHIGPFPAHFLAACSRRAEYFNEQGHFFVHSSMLHNNCSLSNILYFFLGSLLRVQKPVPRSIDECLRFYRLLDEAQIAPAAAFIQRCLTIDPDVRPSALELLNDEWLRDV